MRTDVLTLDPARAVSDLPDVLEGRDGRARQRLFPVVGKDGLLPRAWSGTGRSSAALRDRRSPGCRPGTSGAPRSPTATRRSAPQQTEVTLTRLWVLPVVVRRPYRKLLGLIAQHDLTRAGTGCSWRSGTGSGCCGCDACRS
ncbi:MAG: hypothetical protein R3C32_04835 [Chloroflexota bacterium]